MRKRVLFLSDLHLCHIDYCGVPTRDRMERMITFLNDEYARDPFDALLLLGDYSLDFWAWLIKGSYLARGVSDTARFLQEILPRLPRCAVRMIPGNHEQYGEDKWRELTGFSRTGEITVGDTLFLLLDTFSGNLDPTDHSDGTYTPVDVEAVRRRLAQSDEPRVVLCAHWFDADRESAAFKTLLQTEKRIVALVAGHNHRAFVRPFAPDCDTPLLFDGQFSEIIDADVDPQKEGWGVREMILTDDFLQSAYITAPFTYPGDPAPVTVPYGRHHAVTLGGGAAYLRSRAAEVLEGCILTADDGTALYSPDGNGHYRALWTRDFAYMVEQAGDLIPLDRQKACIDYLIAGMRADGWVPDRVDTSGKAYYTAGGEDFPGLPNLDNGAFLVLAADTYLAALPKAEAKAQFAGWQEALCRGVDCLPVDGNGLIVNDTDPPHSPYGFTDCIVKTGVLAMESLLLWRAVKALAARGAGERYAAWSKRIEAAFAAAFADDSGMLFAATGIGRQIDVWASCYAVSIGFPLPDGQKEKIADWLAAHADGITWMGQIRHLPAGEHWEKTLSSEAAPEEYQNGAFWATASGWFCDAVADRYPELASRVLTELIACFREDGIWECVNRGGYRKLHPYVASATAAYSLIRPVF